MKRILLTISLLLNLVWIISADFKGTVAPAQEEVKVSRPQQCGYRIIEFGKGVDCHGDTILLQKQGGFMKRVKK